jgi:pyrrolidone-carboxylate peptidase
METGMCFSLRRERVIVYTGTHTQQKQYGVVHIAVLPTQSVLVKELPHMNHTASIYYINAGI